jgi:DNA-binding PadR family transcriptional regulator
MIYFQAGFDGDGPMGRRAQGRRTHARVRVVNSADLRLLLLSLIEAQPSHGYDLIRAIEQLTDGAYAPSPGMIYPALSMMGDAGQIAAQIEGGSRKVFAITPVGSAHLAGRRAELDAVVARLGQLPSVDRERHAPIRRAMSNLKAVLGNSIARAEEERQHQIAALIDEAAQAIERLR